MEERPYVSVGDGNNGPSAAPPNSNGAKSSNTNDELRSKLLSLEEKVASSRARRWDVRERMRDLRAQLQSNAQAQQTSHAALDQLKVQAKVLDVIERRAELEELRKQIAALEVQQRQCLQKLHVASGGEIPEVMLATNGLDELTRLAEPKKPQDNDDDAANSQDLTNEAIARLLAQSAHCIAKMQQDKAEFAQEQLLIEERLHQLHEQLSPNNPIDEPTLQDVYDMAANIDEIVAANVAAAQSSIKDLEGEAAWLDTGQTDQWQALTQSLADRVNQMTKIKEDELSLKNLIAAVEEANEVREVQHPLNSSDGQALFVGEEIYEDVLLQVIKETAEYVHATCVYSDMVVRRSILDSLLSTPTSELKPRKSSKPPGRDAAQAAEVHRTMLDATAYEFGQAMSRSRTKVGDITVSMPTQYVVHAGDGPLLEPRRWAAVVDKTAQARNSDGHKWIAADRIIMEREISRGIHMTALPKKLVLPEPLGGLTALEMFSSASFGHSSIVAGGSSGSFCMWTLPAEHNGDILLTAVSPKLPQNEQSPIEEIRWSIDGTSQVVTLDAKGAIRIWSMEPITHVGKRRMPHTPSMFPQSFQQYAPVVPACIAYVTFEALLFHRAEPLPKKIVQSSETRAIRVCFEASTTFTLRQPSVLIAVENGDVVKFNTDYEVGAAAAPIVQPAATPALEFANPLGVKDGIEVFAADTERRGNKVRREVFDFHRSPLLFLGTAGELDELVVTIDEDGVLAVWETWSRKAVLTVTGLHKPNRTCRIDLTLPMFASTGEETGLPIDRAPELELADLQSVGIQSSTASAEQLDSQTSYLLSAEVDDCGFLFQTFGEPDPAEPSSGTIHKVWTDTATNKVVRHVIAKARVTECSGSVIDIKATSTREEICFLAEYARPNARGKKAVISTLNLKTLEFAFPRYAFSVDESNKVLDWAIGPLMREPLTFYAFILTDHALRMVSLVTGQVQRTIDLRTFVPRGTLQTKPQFVRVCGRQRAMLLGSPTSRQLFCCQFSHDYDGLSLEEARDIACLEYFRELQADDAQHYVTAPLIDTKRRLAAMDERARITDLVLDTIHGIIDHIVDSCTQDPAIEELFGAGPLGTIHPTKWTVPKQSIEQAQLSVATMLALESQASDDDERDTGDDDEKEQDQEQER